MASIPHEEYVYTPNEDWFTPHAETWLRLFPHITSKEPRVLEIGTWEGRSAVFLLENLCASGGDIICIDHFELELTPEGVERHRKVVHNLSLTRKPYRIMKSYSFPALAKLLEEELAQHPSEQGYDWIYVDGSHDADDTMLDGELVWRLAKKGAIIVFDDYHWDREPENSNHHPRPGIDALMKVHAGEFEVLSSSEQYQMVLKKTSEMRIGFCNAPVSIETKSALFQSFGYGINVVMIADSAYAIGAGVVAQSIVETTPGRITLYVIDCGLSNTDKERLRSIASREETTIVFCDVPEPCLTRDMGAMWAKIDMISFLPVERVLFLGKFPIGATPEIGFEDEYKDWSTYPYFSSGILLIDLSRCRAEYDSLVARSWEMHDSKLREQDVLNAHFDGRWKRLDLVWNAQGLGTYADYSTPARNALSLKAMKTSPKIVHFAGPVHPTLFDALNPY